MPELVLESANMILHWDRFTKTDTIDFNRPDIVLINTENKRAFLIDTAVPLTHYLPTTETEKIQEYENLVPEINHMWKLNNIYAPLVISTARVVTKNFLKYLENSGLTKKS